MLISKMVQQINRLISNNSSLQISYEGRLAFYMDTAVDYINTRLKTNFKTPEELYLSYKTIYDAVFADKFLGMLLDFPSDVTAGKVFFHAGENERTCYIRTSNDTWDELDLNEGLTGGVINPVKYNYTAIPDRYIRTIIIYLVASYFLEEEDELESQYAVYKGRADNAIDAWLRRDFSSFSTKGKSKRFSNPNTTVLVPVGSSASNVSTEVLAAMLGVDYIVSSFSQLSILKDVPDGAIAAVLDVEKNRWMIHRYNANTNTWSSGEVLSLIDLFERPQFYFDDEQATINFE